MRIQNRLLRFSCLALLLTAAHVQASLAQTSAASGTPNEDAAATSSRNLGISASLTYGNNLLFFGRTQTTQYPYLSADFTYKSKPGIWGSVVGYNLLNTATLLDETDVSVGWDGDLSKSVDASISYSRFLFPATSPLVKAAVNNSVDGYVGWDWQYVYSRLNASYLFGGANDVFLTLDNSRYFEIPKVFSADGYLSFQPRVSVLAGTQSFAQTSIIRRENGNGRPPRGGSGQGPTTTVTTETKRFRVLNYELRLPMTYTLGKVSLETAWRYSIPVNLLPGDVTRARSYWTAGVAVSL